MFRKVNNYKRLWRVDFNKQNVVEIELFEDKAFPKWPKVLHSYIQNWLNFWIRTTFGSRIHIFYY